MNSISIKLTGLFLFVCLSSFGQRVTDEKVYFTYPSRVGLLYVENPIEYLKTKNIPIAQSGIFVTHIRRNVVKSGKYDEALAVVEPLVSPADTIKQFFLNSYARKKKTITLVSARIDSGFNKFKGPRKSGKFYYDLDLRPLREQLQVDELLAVSVRYGVNSEYTLGVEMTRGGFARIQYQIINLRDNSFIIKDHSDGYYPLGEWNTPPEYENLKKSIKTAIKRVIESEADKYN